MLIRFSLLATLLLSESGCLGSFVPCEPCDQKVMSMCPPVPVGCQLVKEPGCGCCLTCALPEGQSCGVYTGTCTHGLRCLPKSGEEKPLHALLHGRGVCANEKMYKPLHPGTDGYSPEEAMLVEVPESLLPQAKVPLYGARDHISSRKAQAMRQAKDRKRQQAKLHSVSSLDYSTLALDKLQPEFGPCRRKLDGIIQRMKNTSRVLALSLYLPNCDKKGFFKHKQCKPSRGRKRGICWCVDRFGVQLPGTDYSGVDIQCKDPESNSNKNE
ncbi:insulin-like growth factor-binding protein 5 [Oncorhynchus tshawytscha]|uniref:Insulin-like growth factor-binding protein 5 n=1 Tax=Oncorhynchus tshawytscha TaxID=74940 RepID=A0AAZ3RBH2_ONCTS|nr:insulin-like growth factor-binding protein 5 [Oncorhynchus tshawytscha]